MPAGTPTYVSMNINNPNTCCTVIAL